MEQQGTIHWTRHALSCANVAPTGKGKFYYSPNLTFIGMQQAIQLGIRYYNNQNIDVVFVSPSIRTIMTALLAFRTHPTIKKIYVIPYISENVVGSPDYQNKPVESTRLFRIIAFIKDWLEKHWFEKYDDIELIIRLDELKKFIGASNIYIDADQIDFGNTIDSFLKCHEANKNEVKSCEYSVVFDNMINNIDALFLKNEKVNNNNELKKFFLKLVTKDKQLYRGPEIDFSLLRDAEKKEGKTADQIPPNMEKFYSEYKNYLERIGIRKHDVNIACISHGNVLGKHFNIHDHMDNTQVLEHNITTGTKNYNAYMPIDIKANYPNLAALNNDICRTKSIRGAINFPLWYSEKERKASTWNPIHKPKLAHDVNDDVKEAYATEYLSEGWWYTYPDYKTMKYWSNEYTDDAIKEREVLQGGNMYKHKYLKYKKKYLQQKLKNKY